MNNALNNAGGNFTTTKAGFAAGTTTTTTTANTTLFAIQGKAYSAAGASNVATPTTDANTGAAFLPVSPGYGTSLTFGFNASGALKVAQGSIEKLDASGAFIKAPELGELPDTAAAFGIVTVKVLTTYVTSTTWICGSHNFAATTGLSFVFTDVMSMPTRPVI